MVFGIELFLTLLAIYTVVGLLVGLLFLFNAVKIDPHMQNTKKGVRLLLLPGVIATWPLFILKFFKPNSK